MERLSQRLKVLEKLLLVPDDLAEPGSQYHVHAGPCCASECAGVRGRSNSRNSQNERAAVSGNGSDAVLEEVEANNGSRKRKRGGQELQDFSGSPYLAEQSVDGFALPPGHILDAVINKYFITAHHWIPMVHERRFRSRLGDLRERQRLEIVLHAMTYITIRMVAPSIVTKEEGQRYMKASKNAVLLAAFDDLSVENLQALAMVAFDSVS